MGVCPYCGVSQPVAQIAIAQPGWGAPPQNSNKALASLVCGVLFFFWPAAVAAVILGHIALSDIKKSAGRLAGHGMAVAGLLLGYLGLAFIPILIIAAISIPNLLRSRMAANEASAVGGLRTYNTAMVTYAAQCPSVGYPKTLASLGPGEPGPDRCTHADLVEQTMALQVPVRSGYHFSYAAEPDPDGHVTKYLLAADPVSPGATGVRHFFTDESGVIRYSLRDSANANSEPLQ